MKRLHGRFARVLGALAALPFLAAASDSPLLVREQVWTARTETLAYDLTHAPAECPARGGASAEIGRALFRSPNLLGGPAARAGLSCQSCHVNGRTNGRFFLPELTDRMGAADVTSEWSSRVRGDGEMNPVDIPDLAGVARRTSFGHARDPSLEHFVRSVIVEEFQGQPPPQAAFDGLIAYLRTLGGGDCSDATEAVTLRDAADDVGRALAAAEHAEPATARAVILAAQDAIGRIVERLPAGKFAEDRRRLEALARELGAYRNAGDVAATLAAAAPGWRTRFDAAVSRVAPREARTYFNEDTLRQALSAARLPLQSTPTPQRAVPAGPAYSSGANPASGPRSR